MKKIKVYTLTDEWASPKCIIIMKGEDGESLDVCNPSHCNCLLQVLNETRVECVCEHN